jgi:nitrogen fixation NifU-like protein
LIIKVAPRIRSWDTGGMHGAAVLDHFQNPRNCGDLPDATATVEVTNPVCGDELKLAVRVEDGLIVAARFRARGCQAAMACSSLLTEMIAGKSVAALRDITAEQIADALGGLPPATRHGSQLAEDALDAVIEKLLRPPESPRV